MPSWQAIGLAVFVAALVDSAITPRPWWAHALLLYAGWCSALLALLWPPGGR